MKAAYDAKKAAQEANKVKKKQQYQQAKVSSLFNINSLHPSIYFIFTAAAALPPPIELFSSDVFKVGDLVQSIPDTTSGVDPVHPVAITGASYEPFLMLLQSRLSLY